MRLLVLCLGLSWLTVAAQTVPPDKTKVTKPKQNKPGSAASDRSTGQTATDPASHQSTPNSPNAGANTSSDTAPTNYYCGTIAAYSDDHSKLQLEKLQVENLPVDQAQCKPDSNAKPDISARPDANGKTDASARPDANVKTDASAKTDTSGNPATSATPATSEKPSTHVAIQVQNQALKDSMKNWKRGDKVIAGVTAQKNNGVETLILQDLRPQTYSEASLWGRLGVAAAATFILLAFTWIISRNVRGLLFIGEDNRYSNSKTQVSLWFGLVIVSYVTTFVLRWCHTGFIGGIGIPTNLLLLSGLSGLTFAAAKGITASKVSAAAATNAATDVATNASATAAAHATAATANAAAATQAVTVAAAIGTVPDAATLTAAAAATNAATVANREAATAAAAPLANAPKVQQKVAAPAASFPGDLIKDDKGKFDFGNYQMMVITLLAIASYGVVIYNFLGTLEMRASTTVPDVDTTILALFGVGHGAYLTKKAVTDASQ